jgi:hypothetical protein
MSSNERRGTVDPVDLEVADEVQDVATVGWYGSQQP